MTQDIEAKRFRDLLRLLDAFTTLNEQLFALIDSKIDAMKQADLHAMRDCGEREQEMVQRLQEREGFRRQLMDAIGGELGLSSRAARAMCITELGSRLSEPQRTALMDAADRLRKAIFKVMQANRLAGVISREILHHLKWVFAAVRPRDEKPAGYAGNGDLVPSCGTPMYETVG